jgi:hypothetical protein
MVKIERVISHVAGVSEKLATIWSVGAEWIMERMQLKHILFRRFETISINDQIAQLWTLEQPFRPVSPVKFQAEYFE